MKVLHLCRSYLPAIGGIEAFVAALAAHSSAIDVTPSVLCYDQIHGQRDRLAHQEIIEGVSVRRVRAMIVGGYGLGWLPLSELRSADILHVHGVGSQLDFATLTQRMHGRPIVVSTHGGIFHTSVTSSKRLYFYKLLPRTARRVSRFVASSRHDLEMFRPVTDRMVLIENGVELSPVPAVAKVAGRLIYVGRLARSKRVDLLVRTAALAARTNPAIELRLVGPDWDGLTAELQQLAQALGFARLTITGAVSREQLLDEMAAATLFVSASEFEGFGLSLVEAMHSRCVPIVSAIQPFRDLLTQGADGWTTNFADSQAAELINRVLSQDISAQQTAAAITAEKFSWQHKIHEFGQLYRQVLSGH